LTSSVEVLAPDPAGVGDEPHAGGLGGVDGVGVLADALAGLATRDQQQFVGAGERLGQRRLVVEVRTLDHDAAVGQVSEGLGAPSGGDDLLGRDAPLQQGFDHQTAQLAGGASDDDGHVLVLLSWLVC
jgi:hypothetical protein